MEELPKYPVDFKKPEDKDGYHIYNDSDINEDISQDCKQYLNLKIEDLAEPPWLASSGDTIIEIDPLCGKISVFKLQGFAVMPEELKDKFNIKIKEAGF